MAAGAGYDDALDLGFPVAGRPFRPGRAPEVRAGDDAVEAEIVEDQEWPQLRPDN